jgi:hypothetical protein
MATVQPALTWGNPESQLHVAVRPDGLLEIVLGLHCIEVVPRDAGSVQYRMAMGRLVNAGWEVTALGERFGHDTRTLRGWAEALLCADAREMFRRLSGRGAEGKVTGQIVEFALDWWEELKGRARKFRSRILAKVRQVFGVEVSWEALRQPLRARWRERAAERSPADCRAALPDPWAEDPHGEVPEPGRGAAASGAQADGCEGVLAASSAESGAACGAAMGCASGGGNETESAGGTQPVAGPQALAVAPAAASGDGEAAGPETGVAKSSATGCGERQAGGAAENAGTVPVAGPAPAAAVAPNLVAAIVPGGSAVPARGPVLVHHAGQVLAAPWLDTAGVTPRAAGGAPLVWCALELQGAANIEQTRDVDGADLAWFTGGPVPTDQTQRQTLARLLAESPALWLELLRGNALLLDDGPGRGTVFYYDPHTKEYTGGLPFLKGWCGRRHGVARVLHLDFFHTRSGHPCFVVPADNYEDLRDRFFAELQWFDQLFPPEGRKRRLFVIDRAIFGIETFGRFTAWGDDLLTWEKGYTGDGWTEGALTVEFTLSRPRNRSDDMQDWTFRVQEQPWRRDPAWRRLVIRATNPEGRTVEAAALCSASAEAVPTAEAAKLIFSRWLQENDFRILDRHFGMMQMVSRRSQSYADLAHTLPDRPVESVEYRELHAALAAVRRNLEKLLYDRERVADALERMQRDTAAARRRLERNLPRLSRRLAQCQATPDADGKQLRELATLGALAAELDGCRSTLRKAARGRPRLEQRRETLQAAIGSAKSQSDALEQRLEVACQEDSKLRFLAAEGACRPDTAAKHLMDCTRIVARNVFYRLLGDFRRHYDNRRDDLAILRLVSRAAGVLHFRDGVLHVDLWLRATLEPAVRTAIDAFLAALSTRINDHFRGRAVPVQISLLRAAPEL